MDLTAVFDDSNVFRDKTPRSKPLRKTEKWSPSLTEKELIEIKNEVLAKESEHDEKVWGNSALSWKRTKKKEDNETPSKKIKIMPASPSKLMTDYYSPTKEATKAKKHISFQADVSGCDTDISLAEINVTGYLTLSPSVRNNETESILKIDAQKMEQLTSSNMTDSASKGLDSDISKTSGVTENSHLYSMVLKIIINQECKNQKTLEKYCISKDEQFKKLFLSNEYEYFQKFLLLPESACMLYGRMLSRKKGWHKIAGIQYHDISDNIEDIFTILSEEKFVDLNIERENLNSQMMLLNKAELLKLSKTLGIKIPKSNMKRLDLIEVILNDNKSQRSVIDFWGKKDKSTRLGLLQSQVSKTLGKCVKLSEPALSAFNRLLLLFSLTFDIEEEDKWSSVFQKMIKVIYKMICYPSYVINETVIFYIRDDLISYEVSMILMYHFQTAVDMKNYEEFRSIGNLALARFKEILLDDESLKKQLSQIPPFLIRYTAGSVYSIILSKYCETFKEKKDSNEVIEIMSLMLNQTFFGGRRRGNWYGILVRAYEELKQLEKAGSVLMKALEDENVGSVQRFTLQLKGQSILKRKTGGIKDLRLREKLDELCTSEVIEPAQVEIRAKAVAGNKPGFKSMYILQSNDETIYSTVEERVIYYYKSRGFTKVVHAEGLIMQTFFFLLFFDIIYGPSPPGVFQSPYQEAPLDLTSHHFYLNRKDAIDARLTEMRQWTISDVTERILQVYKEHNGECCLVSWDSFPDPLLFQEIAECIGIESLTSVCERFARNYRMVRSGFPDLTAWNPETGKCTFVEVKSPNDKLSPAQKLWLDFLKRLDLDCEVCNVKNIASRYLD